MSLLGFTAFGRKPMPLASQVAVYASFVVATHDKHASFLNIRAPCLCSFLLCRLFVDFLRIHQEQNNPLSKNCQLCLVGLSFVDIYVDIFTITH